MKKLAVVLLLSTTVSANAYPARYYDCGIVFIREQTFHGSGKYQGVFSTNWEIHENYEVTQDRKNGGKPLDLISFSCIP